VMEMIKKSPPVVTIFPFTSLAVMSKVTAVVVDEVIVVARPGPAAVHLTPDVGRAKYNSY
jgi:hypothetical protein